MGSGVRGQVRDRGSGIGDLGSGTWGSGFKFQFGQGSHDIHGLDAHVDDAEEQIEDVPRIFDFFGPIDVDV